MEAALRAVALAGGRDLLTLNAAAERVEAALGRSAAAVGRSVSTHLLVVPRSVTQQTAQELPSLLAATVAPDMAAGDLELAAAARAEALGRGPEALLEELGACVGSLLKYCIYKGSSARPRGRGRPVPSLAPSTL